MSLREKIKEALLPNHRDGEIVYNPNRQGASRQSGKQEAAPLIYIVTNFFEAERIAQNLLIAKSVIVNLTNLTGPDKYRIIDFLSGVVYVINGKRIKLENNIYLFTPTA